MTKNPRHYVNNKEFFAAMVKYHESRLEAEAQDNPAPKVSNYIGTCILKIAEKLSHKHNFINYPFREEMVCDGIENCLHYINNFNPEKSNNPFGYFSTISFYAFLRRIEKEHKHLYIKYKASDHAEQIQMLSTKQVNDSRISVENVEYSDHAREYKDNFVTNYEAKRDRKKIRIK